MDETGPTRIEDVIFGFEFRLSPESQETWVLVYQITLSPSPLLVVSSGVYDAMCPREKFECLPENAKLRLKRGTVVHVIGRYQKKVYEDVLA